MKVISLDDLSRNGESHVITPANTTIEITINPSNPLCVTILKHFSLKESFSIDALVFLPVD